MRILFSSLFGLGLNKQDASMSIMKGKFYIRQTADKLLDAHLDELSEIKELTGLADEHFNFLYLKPIHRYIESIQLVPASESYHHASVGGMLQHIMEVLVNALRIRRGHILPPGVPPEEIEHRKDLWTYLVFIAALLHDAGKMITDVYLEDEKGKPWNLLSSHPQPVTYRVRFNYNRKHKFHEKLGAIALHKIFTPKQIEWVMSDEEAWYTLAHFLIGDYSSAGVLHDIVQKADQASVVANLGGDVKVATSSPAQRPLSERILRTLQNLVANDVISINRPGAFGFYADGWVYFVVSRTLDAVIEKMRSEGQSVPNDRNRLMDELQQFEVIEKTAAGRAVFSTRVKVGEWEQNLKLLKISALKVWTNEDGRPASSPDVRVLELDNDANDTTSAIPGIKEQFVQKVSSKPDPTSDNISATPVAATQSANINRNINTGSVSVEIPIPEFDELDALIKSPGVQVASDEFDMSDFDDNLYDDVAGVSEYKSNSAVQEPVNESKTAPLSPEKTSTPVDEESRERVIQEVMEIAKVAISNSVSLHNEEVLNASALIEFDDPDSHGAQFVKWLVAGIKSASIPMNNPGNLVHLVSEGLFIVSPRIFRQFESETGCPWAQAQKELQRKKINLKTQRGENIFEYEIMSKTGRHSTKKIKGMLIPNPDKKLGIHLSEKNLFMRQSS